MASGDFQKATNDADFGQEMYRLIAALYPFCRSITGDGVRRTLRLLQEHIPLVIHEAPSGAPVFDWTVPLEWNIRDAYIKNSAGERIVDFNKSNLHVMSYSVPTKRKLRLDELKPHLFTLPEHPEWIPYRTSYYQENWGFCLSHKQFLALEDEEYEVCIDASLEKGHLTYAEYYLPGKTTDEILLSCHICHPSLCNDNLSGIALVSLLAKHFSTISRRYSYRFLFIPGTIGSITWLCLNEPNVTNIKHGFVVAGVGNAGDFTYKKSRHGNAEIDRAAEQVLKHAGNKSTMTEFSPYGYDERQFCSPAFNLPIGCVMRTPYGQYPEYHTSADNLDFVHPQYLADSFAKCVAILNLLEDNETYVNQNPKCEPQLGKRGLYRAIGGQTDTKAHELAMLWVLNLSDGNNTLLDIASRAGCRFDTIKNVASVLLQHGLLKKQSP